MTLFTILGLGFFLGMRHATYADHVIAVTTIVSRQRSLRHAAWIGAVWGLGHTLTVFVVGGAIILFGLVIPERLGMGLEFCVALMLFGLGLWSVRELFHAGSHQHPHAHGDYVHTHPHSHEPEQHSHADDQTPQSRLDRRFEDFHLYQTLRPLVVGIAHGLAGSAAVALLVLPLILQPLWAVAYLLVFGAGTIAGMMLITAAIALPVSYTARRSMALHRGLGFATGFLGIGFGIFLGYEILMK
jgi:hypothetical protein